MTAGFGEVLRRLRLGAGLTQEQLADRAGVSVRAVSDLERDPARTPRLSTVALLVAALELDAAAERELVAAAQGADRAAPSVPAGLPRFLAPLIGRDAETDAVAHLLATPGVQLVTLTGPGGVGKTRLAVAAAAAVDPGAVFVDLAPVRDPGLVLPAVAQRLRVDDPGRLAAALAETPRLLVLDNLEQVVDCRADLLGLLAEGPGVRLLVTSRVPLHVRAEREFHLAPLATPPAGAAADADPAAAYRLFVDRARAAGYEPGPGDAAAIGAICRRLDGLPLALELAAARLSVLDAAGLLATLDRTLPVLVDGPHDLPDRQRTMRDTVAWSHRLLSEEGRLAFRRMAVLAAGGRLAGVEALCETPAGVAEVIRWNLAAIDRRGGQLRVVLLEPVREFGLELLAASGEEDALRGRHAALVLEWLAGAADDPSAVGLGNVRAALTWATASGSAELAQRLLVAAAASWLKVGALAEGRRLAVDVLAMPGAAAVDPAVHAAATLAALRLANALWDTALADRLADRAVALAAGHGTAAEHGRALVARGWYHREHNRYAQAEADFVAARALAGDDQALHLAATTHLTYVTLFTGRMAAGAALADEALRLAVRLGDAHAEGEALILACWIDNHTGRRTEMAAKAARAIAIFRELGHAHRLAEALRSLGDGLAFGPDYERALAALGESRRLYAERGEEHLAGQLDSQLAFVEWRLGHRERAYALIRSSLAVSRRFADQWAVAMCTTLLGHFDLASGALDAARTHLEEGAAAFAEIGNPLYVAWNLEGRAALAVAGGDLAAAAALLAERDAVRARLGSALEPFDPAQLARVRGAVERG